MARYLLLLALLVPWLQGCATAKDPWANAKPEQKRVLASFPPLYSMAQAVAGEDAYVRSFLSAQGPHGFHDQPNDMLKLRGADLIIMNGLGLDDRFMDRLIIGSRNRSARVVKLGEELPKKDLQKAEEEPEHEEKGHAHHHHGEFDPHVWLGPPEAKIMVKKIAEQLVQLDPAHSAGYEKRAAEFSAELDKLEAEGKELLKGKKNRRILTMHESLGYFAKAFDLDIKGSLQIQPGNDPDAARLSKLAQLCKAEDVCVIAVEPQFPAKLAKTLQNHLGFAGHPIRLVEIDPLETAPLAADGNPERDHYLRTMRKNIESLARELP